MNYASSRRSADIVEFGRSVLAKLRSRAKPPRPAAESPATRQLNSSTYRDLYEAHARALPGELSIGAGDYDVMGSIMLSALVQAGLEPAHTLVDFGCGTGRLAAHAVPYLAGGSYIGTDISPTMLLQADATIRALSLEADRAKWLLQRDGSFDLPDESVDYFAAFSVFTHMEHEDAFVYLKDAHRVTKPGGTFVFSCLTMDLNASRDVFLDSASLTLDRRWERVRNVTTTYELMAAISELAGWTVERWYKGDVEAIHLLDNPGIFCALGQSICVLRREHPPAS